MKNVYILCEGQTEESVINEVLYPYFLGYNIAVYPIICTTRRTDSKKFKGGVSSYGKIKKELTILCKSHRNEFVTTMFDYYEMPSDTPGINDDTDDPICRINAIEKAIESDLALPNCKFNLMLHEFEGILFSDPDSFSSITDQSVVEEIRKIRYSFPSPEYINNSVETAPSKRIKALIPRYAKIRNGALLANRIGIRRIMDECQHFRDWIQFIVSLSK